LAAAASVGLGLVWSLVPLAGFFAVKPSLDGAGPVFVLAVFSVFWLAGFDIIYATLDEEFDRRAGVRSLPAHLGSYRALKVSALFHLLAFFTLIFLYGFWLGGPLTVMLLAIVGVLLFLEQYFSAYVDFSFFHVNIWIGVAVLVFIMTGVKGV
jgi:4-hydroxybenzoate polyprenyltransferase